MPVMTTPGWATARMASPIIAARECSARRRTARSRGLARCCSPPPSPISSSRTPLRSAKSPQATPQLARDRDQRRCCSALSLCITASLRVFPCARSSDESSLSQLERSVYVWVASLMLIAVCYCWRAVPGVLWQVPTPWSWAMLAGAAGGNLADASKRGGHRRPGPGWCASGSNPKSQPPARPGDGSSRPTGPYGWVRHPIYLGWILVVFSVGTMTMTRLVFAAISSVYLLVAIPFEERTLRAQSPTLRRLHAAGPAEADPGL